MTSAGAPGASDPPGRLKIRAGAALIRSIEIAQRQHSGSDQLGDREAERRLQPDDAVGRVIEFALLGIVVMGSVVGADGVDGSVPESLADRFPILRFPERRVHLGVGVVALALLVRQREMMGTRLSGHPDPLLLGPPNQLDRAPGRHVTEMHVTAGVLRQKNVAGHHDLLGRRREFP